MGANTSTRKGLGSGACPWSDRGSSPRTHVVCILPRRVVPTPETARIRLFQETSRPFRAGDVVSTRREWFVECHGRASAARGEGYPPERRGVQGSRAHPGPRRGGVHSG